MPVISFRYCYPCKSLIRCHFSISSRNFEPFPHLRCSFFINNSTTSRVSSFSLKTTFPIISLLPFVKIYRLFSHVQAILCCSSIVLPVIAATPASSEYTYFLMNVSSFLLYFYDRLYHMVIYIIVHMLSFNIYKSFNLFFKFFVT